MYCDLSSQYIQVRKLFKGGNYSREETIRGNTVHILACLSIYVVEFQEQGSTENIFLLKNRSPKLVS